MRLTVESILDYEILKSAKVLTGEKSLKEKQVQWVSVIEMPVENFVRKNEVVLTTAIGCHNNLESLKTFIQDIIDSEASALMIATGRYIFDIPPEIITLANTNNFIIIELPWEVRFSNVVEEIMKEINDYQYKEREKSGAVQQELLKFILSDSDLDRILKFIERQIGFPIIITDQSGLVQEKKGHSSALLEKWNNYFLKGTFPIKKESPFLSQDPLFQKFHTAEIDGNLILQIPLLQVSEEPQGYIHVIFPVNSTIESYLTPFRVNVLEHAATTIALWLSRKNAIENTKVKLRSDFVQELSKGEFISSEQANSRANLLGYNLKLPYISIVGIPENLEELFGKRKQKSGSYQQWLEGMVSYIEEEVYYAAYALKREVMMTYQGEQLLIFFEVACKTERENASDFLDLIERRLRNLLPEVIISWGIGEFHEGFKGFSESYQNASIAANIGRRKKGIGQRMLYDNTRVDRLLFTLAQNDKMKEVIMSTIHPLVQYDKQRNMDLIGTFSAYNQYHGNVSQTARALNLHRQSLLYRLRKIESLTGLTLTDPDDLFLLDLSIKTWKVGIDESLEK